MNSILTDLETIYRAPARGVDSFLLRKSTGALHLFATVHLPLLLLYPLYSILSPWSLYRGSWPSLKALLSAPLLAIAALAVAMVYDRILENSAIRGIADPGVPVPKNIALFLHLPVAAAGVFFFIHPMVGHLMVLATALFSLYRSIKENARLRGLTFVRALVHYLNALIFLFIPLLVLLFLLNLVDSLQILRSL